MAVKKLTKQEIQRRFARWNGSLCERSGQRNDQKIL